MTVTLGDVMMEEFRVLKAEQTARINTRDNLVYATLAVLGAVGWAVVQSGQRDVLLAVPFPTLILGWLYLGNDQKIADMRRYIRTSLRPQLAARLHGPYDPSRLFGWEQQPPDRWLWLWRWGQVAVNTALFLAPAVGSLAFWAVAAVAPAGWLCAAAAVEAVAVVPVLGVVVLNAWGRNPVTPPPADNDVPHHPVP